MFIPQGQNRTEVPGRWWLPMVNWQSYMGIAPEAANESTVLVASGVDGREKDVLRRSLGFVLLEDLKRRPMRPSIYPVDLTGVQPLWYSSDRVDALTTAGSDPILQCEPFEISRHSATAADTLRGFVVRTRQTLRLNTDVAGSNVNFSEDRPYIALVLVNDNSADPIGTTSRFSYVVPLVPVSRWYKQDVGDPFGVDLPHYTDDRFPNFNPADGSTPTTPIYANDEVVVSFNQRFIYLWSTTGEFEPITLWYDTSYGFIPTFGGGSGQMSNRSLGFHWEKHGVVIPEATQGAIGSTDSGTGLTLAGTYQLAYRWVDSYRNRYTTLSQRQTATVSANDRFQFYGVKYSDVAKDTELTANYDAYQVFCTLKGDATIGKQGGTPYFADYMNTRYFRFRDRPLMYGDFGSGAQPWNAYVFDTVRTDSTLYAVFQDRIFMSDLSLASSYPYTTFDDPGTTPTKVASAIDFQGVTLVASVDGQSGVDFSTGALTPRNTASGYVTLRWSSLNSFAPEVYPTANTFTTKIRSGQPVRLVQVGDFAYLVGDGRIVRIRRVGTGLEIIEVFNGFYLASKRALCDVRGILFGVFRDGVFLIDPTSSSVTRLDNVDRLIRRLWPDTLDSVDAEYDSAQDVVYLLNKTTGGVALVHPSTQKVTLLERTPYAFASSLRVRDSRRVVLTTVTGRFVYPRLWESEDEEGSRTMQAWTKRLTDWPLGQRNYLFRVVSTAYDAGNNWTTVVLAEDAVPLSAEDGASAPAKPLGTPDFYWGGTSVYRVDEATNHGASFEVRGWLRATTAGNPSRLLLRGDVRADLPSGAYISVDPIPFAILVGPVSSGNQSLGTVKRTVAEMNAVVPWVSGTTPTTVPFFEAGVIDVTDTRADEPQPINGPWFPLADTPLRRSRRTFLPRTGVVYTPENPATLFGYIGVSGASGTLLFPFIRTFLTEPGFGLREFAAHGTISASERTE